MWDKPVTIGDALAFIAVWYGLDLLKFLITLAVEKIREHRRSYHA